MSRRCEDADIFNPLRAAPPRKPPIHLPLRSSLHVAALSWESGPYASSTPRYARLRHHRPPRVRIPPTCHSSCFCSLPRQRAQLIRHHGPIPLEGQAISSADAGSGLARKEGSCSLQCCSDLWHMHLISIAFTLAASDSVWPGSCQPMLCSFVFRGRSGEHSGYLSFSFTVTPSCSS